MTQVWKPDPQFCINIGGTTYTMDQSAIIDIVRPENNISSCTLTINDYNSSKFVGVFDQNTAFNVQTRYGTDSWATIFNGNTFDLMPTLSNMGELLTVSAWGKEYGLLKTHCNTSYGTQSRRNHAIVSGQGIIQDLITNYVNLALNNLPVEGATGWALDNSDVENVHAGCVFSYFNSPYMLNFDALNRVCDTISGWATQNAQPGVHWYCDTDAHVRVKEIDVDSTDGLWTYLWKGAIQTLAVKQDMILTEFHKSMDGYCNDVIFASPFRLPAEDYWTETHFGDWLYDNAAGSNSATCVVGADALRVEPTDHFAHYHFSYPFAQTAAWDLTKIGSEKTPSYLSFYARQDKDLQLFNIYVMHDANKGSAPFTGLSTWVDGQVDKWVHISLPIGPYHHHFIDDAKLLWDTRPGCANPIDWSDVNWIEFYCNPPDLDNKGVWIDDIHFSGNIVRRAYDTDEWATYYDQQKFIRNDTAISDIIVAAQVAGTTDQGTAGRLACAELYRGKKRPLVGAIEIPLAVDFLPGQQVHIHACQQTDGTYRIDSTAVGNFRATEVHQILTSPPIGCRTQLALTNDLTTSRPVTIPTTMSLMQEHLGGLGTLEALDLKGGAIDNLISVSAIDY